MAPVPGWARIVAGRLLIDLRVTPKADRDALTGIHRSADGTMRLAVKVRAAPDKGAANASVEKVLARALRCPKSAVAIHSGQTSRLKTAALSGDPHPHIETLRTIVSDAPA